MSIDNMLDYGFSLGMMACVLLFVVHVVALVFGCVSEMLYASNEDFVLTASCLLRACVHGVADVATFYGVAYAGLLALSKMI